MAEGNFRYLRVFVHDPDEYLAASGNVIFGLNAPGVSSIALNTRQAERVAQNIALPYSTIPDGYWKEMEKFALIDPAYAASYL